jgi:hypothetical protein
LGLWIWSRSSVYPCCMNTLKKALWLVADGREESWKETAQLHCHVQTIFKGSASEFPVEDTMWGIIWNLVALNISVSQNVYKVYWQLKNVRFPGSCIFLIISSCNFM